MTNTGPGPDCFECALNVLMCTMEKVHTADMKQLEHRDKTLLLSQKFLQPFLSSPVFSQYLNEIASALKNAAYPLTRSKRSGKVTRMYSAVMVPCFCNIHIFFPGSSSTICSEVSGISSSAISTTASNHQTGGNSIHHVALSNSNAETSMVRLANSISNESLLIDTKQLNDPDSLWQRKRTT